MKRDALLLIIFLICVTISAHAQLLPRDAIKAMARGINMGNTLEPPGGEGTWGNPAATEANFDDYRNAGFTCVRLPITWDRHTDTIPPYTINQTWLNRIEQIVDWGLSRHLIIIINAHHDGWIKDAYTARNIARFDSIWSQVATRFKNKSDSLLFEIINEPYPMTLANVNDLNARTLQTIRRTNPTRIVLFSGHQWSNSTELIAAAIPRDSMLIGYYHSYDPYPFGLNGPGTYGSDADINATIQKFNDVTAWGAAHNIPVVLSEFGYVSACEYNSRMCAYATVVDQALAHHVAFNVWEDGGSFKFYERTAHTWGEIKDILIHTYAESPYKMRINNYRDTLVQLRWNNRTAENDSIVVERRVDNGPFTFLTKISPTASECIDTTVVTANNRYYYYRLKANLKDSIEIQSYPVRQANAKVGSGPYSGTAAAVPGTVEAENFDLGTEGVSYHDSDFVNVGNAYRQGAGVDIYAYGVTYYVAQMATGEWMNYTINVQTEGDYTVSVNMGAVTAGGLCTLEFRNGTTPPFIAPATGRLTLFRKVSQVVHLVAGQQVMRLHITGTPEFSINNIIFASTTSIEAENAPDRFRLLDNYPNPFNPSTTIAFQLPKKSYVTLKIYDIIGKEVATILSEAMEAGTYSRQWNAYGVSSGVYYYRIQAGVYSETKKLLLLK